MTPATSARESFATRFPPPPEINLRKLYFFQLLFRLKFFLVIPTASTGPLADISYTEMFLVLSFQLFNTENIDYTHFQRKTIDCLQRVSDHVINKTNKKV